jgi:hypothetical protein
MTISDGTDEADAEAPAERVPAAGDAEVVEGDDAGRVDPSTTEEPEEPAADAADLDEADAVAIGEVGGGRSLTGVAVGGTLVAGLAAAAVVRTRRRGDDLGPQL